MSSGIDLGGLDDDREPPVAEFEERFTAIQEAIGSISTGLLEKAMRLTKEPISTTRQLLATLADRTSDTAGIPQATAVEIRQALTVRATNAVAGVAEQTAHTGSRLGVSEPNQFELEFTCRPGDVFTQDGRCKAPDGSTYFPIRGGKDLPPSLPGDMGEDSPGEVSPGAATTVSDQCLPGITWPFGTGVDCPTPSTVPTVSPTDCPTRIVIVERNPSTGQLVVIDQRTEPATVEQIPVLRPPIDQPTAEPSPTEPPVILTPSPGASLATGILSGISAVVLPGIGPLISPGVGQPLVQQDVSTLDVITKDVIAFVEQFNRTGLGGAGELCKTDAYNIPPLTLGGTTFETLVGFLTSFKTVAAKIPFVGNAIEIIVTLMETATRAAVCQSPGSDVTLILIRALYAIGGAFLGDGVREAAQPFAYMQHRSCPRLFPVTDQATEAFLANAVDDPTFQAWVEINNNCFEPWKAIVEARRAHLDPTELVIMRRREIISASQYKADMRRNAYIRPGDDDKIFKLSEFVPPIVDLVRFMVRDVEDEAVVNRFVLDTDFDKKWAGETKKFGKWQGIDDDTAKRYWRAIGSYRHRISYSRCYTACRCLADSEQKRK